MRISRLVVAAALVGAFALAATSSASAASATCTGASGKIKVSPGLTATETAQNVQIKGELTGCTGTEAKESYKFQIHAKTAPISCKALTEGATATEESSILIKSKGEGNSSGTGSIELIEGSGTLTSGPLSGGAFEGGTASGSLTESFTGGATCGKETEPKPGHKKKAKAVNKGTVTGGSVTIS
jgi:hypothetical protein